MRSRSPSVGRLLMAVMAGIGAGVVLAGCATPGLTAGPTPTSSPTITNKPQASAVPLALRPEGTALQNIDYFTSVLKPLLDPAPKTPGQTIIETLVAAGFDKAQMELTPDKTAVGLDADSVQFSVRMNGTCLIGQSGNVGFHSAVAPLLSTGTCLVGKTRAIDW